MTAVLDRHRLDGAMLVSLLASGLLWLLLLTPPWTSALGVFVLGAAYVAVGSVAMAAVHGRAEVLVQRELLTLALLWVLDVALWAALTGIGTLVTDGPGELGSALCFGLWFGLWIGTPAFVMWQVLALVLRGCRWRGRLG
jgi:hypothetical protein